MRNILLDTDVVLDFLLDRKPFSDDTLHILLKCEKKEMNAFVTPVIVANTYYLLRQKASHSYVIEQLKILLKIISVLSMDQKQVLSALDSKFTDFEDALQYFSALQNTNIEAILTRNGKDFKHAELPVFTPKEFLATL